MKLRSWTLIATCIPAVACAEAPHYVYPYNSMTGEQVVSRLTREPISPQDYLDRDLTHSYVNGIKDGTQGSAWCFKGTILPHELNIELAHAIKESRQPGELKGNAAPFVIAELQKRYPCDPSKGGRP